MTDETETDLPWANEDAIFPGSGAASVEQARADTPSAIEPSRVLVLDEDEQNQILDALNYTAKSALLLDYAPVLRLHHRVQQGDEYTDELDEMARITLTKRRLAAEIVRINRRIEALTEPVVDRLNEIGAKSLRHDATGALIQRDDTIRLAHRDSEWGTEEKAIAKDAAGEVLANTPETEAFVQSGWNHRRVESFYRDRYRHRLDEMLELPEDERRPVDPDDVIPAELRPFYRLVVAPRVKVTQ